MVKTGTNNLRILFQQQPFKPYSINKYTYLRFFLSDNQNIFKQLVSKQVQGFQSNIHVICVRFTVVNTSTLTWSGEEDTKKIHTMNIEEKNTNILYIFFFIKFVGEIMYVATLSIMSINYCVL